MESLDIKTIAISFGGSVVNDGKINIEEVKTLCNVITKFSINYKFGIVVGGGKIARDYINALKHVTHSDFEADEIAIKCTYVNAYLIYSILTKNSKTFFAYNFQQAKDALQIYDIVVMGGTIPGITTDTDTMLLAEAIKAKKMINISKVGAIYDKDPSKPNAKKIEKIKIQELLKMAEKEDKRKAGTHFPIDKVALTIALRSKITIDFIPPSARDLENAIKGKKHKGTQIIP